jgi:uncharacterized membrane protein YsdA (DUF1294 family)
MRVLSYSLSGMMLSLTAALIMEGVLSLSLITGWLIAINVFTAVFYGIDKLNSIWVGQNEKRKAMKVRVPESALLLLALVGGSPAAVAAMLAFRHKTSKAWFMFRLVLVVVAQGVAAYLFRDSIPWP